MKHGIELNGVANCVMLLDQLTQTAPSLYNHQYNLVEKMQEELVFLERYMIAQHTAATNNTTPPFWHEVKADPKKYPTNKERMGR